MNPVREPPLPSRVFTFSCEAYATRYDVEKDDQLALLLTLTTQAGILEIPAVAIRWIVRCHLLGVEFPKLDAKASRQLMKYLTCVYNADRAVREVTRTES